MGIAKTLLGARLRPYFSSRTLSVTKWTVRTDHRMPKVPPIRFPLSFLHLFPNEAFWPNPLCPTSAPCRAASHILHALRLFSDMSRVSSRTSYRVRVPVQAETPGLPADDCAYYCDHHEPTMRWRQRCVVSHRDMGSIVASSAPMAANENQQE